MQIGEKIRVLRSNKGITQAELASALSVSAQTVSKWETHLSSPDISILPVLAAYFGITMDELFGYRLDALNYKERFVRFLFDNGMLRFGDFELKSGRRSPYRICSGDYRTGSQIAKLGEFYAECIRRHAPGTQCLVGIDGREAPVLVATAMVLFDRYGVDVGYCVDPESLKSVCDDTEVTLLADVFTSGHTLREALENIRHKVGRAPSSVVVCVDRKERAENTSFSARHEIEHTYGVKIHSIADVDDVIRGMENGVISANEYLDRMVAYRAQYEGV